MIPASVENEPIEPGAGNRGGQRRTTFQQFHVDLLCHLIRVSSVAKKEPAKAADCLMVVTVERPYLFV